MEIAPGQHVADRFEVLECAGHGGMAVVYRARDLESGEDVALKLIRAGSARPERFEREASVLSELHHPHIVRYVAHGRAADGEASFLAMEWLEGQDLAQRLQHGGLNVDETLTLARALLDALAWSHGQGIVHRDIKPSNIFLIDGCIDDARVLDFGIAWLEDAATSLTRTGVTLGTPGYMPPEQATGDRIDARSDLFSVGCVIFECLTGRRPFPGDHVMSILARMLFEPIPRVRDVRPSLSEALDDFVAGLMHRERTGRTASAQAALQTLDALSGRTSLGGGLPVVAHSGALQVEGQRAAITDSERSLVSVVMTRLPGKTRAADATVADDDPALNALRHSVERRDGKVRVLADGAVLIVMRGARLPTELAARAASCALDVVATVEGPVVVGTGWAVMDRQLPDGRVLDRCAARLDAHGGTASVIIDRDTHELLGGRFVSEPIAAAVDQNTDDVGYWLRGARRDPSEGRQLLGRETRCVGRRRELALLEASFDDAAEESVAQSVLVVAPAGTGKSRLARELTRRIRARRPDCEVVRGMAELATRNVPYALLRELIRDAVGIGDDQTPAERRAGVIEAAREVFDEDADYRAAYLGEAADVPFEASGRPDLEAARANAPLRVQRMREAASLWLTRRARRAPLILVIEDVHLADDASLELVQGLVERTDAPLLVLGLARPDVEARHNAFLDGATLTKLHLGRLSTRASERLVREVLGENARSDIVARIVERAEGNAFFLEELIRAAARGQADAAPSTVLAAVQWRLSDLEADARRVLRAASVFGERFDVGGVAALLGESMEIPTIVARLDTLAERELIAGEDRGWTFHHALVRDAAYAMLPEREREMAHGLAADWLASRDDVGPARLAYHNARAGRSEDAAAGYAEAAQHALQSGAVGSALEHVEAGLELEPADATIRRLLVIRAEALAWSADVESQQEAIDQLDAFEPGTESWFVMLEAITLATTHHGDVEDTIAWSERLLEAPARDPRAAARRLVTACRAAMHMLWYGRYARGKDLLAAALEDAEHARITQQEEIWLSYTQATHALFERDFGTARRMVDYAWNTAVANKNVRAITGVGNMRGYIAIQCGRLDAARDQLETVIETLEAADVPALQWLPRHNLATILARTGELERAIELKKTAMNALEAAGMQRLTHNVRIELAEMLLQNLDVDAAVGEAKRACAGLHRFPPVLAYARAVHARCLLAVGATALAHDEAQQAHDVLEELGVIEVGEPLVRLVLIETSLEVGERARAEAVARRAWARIVEAQETLEGDAERRRFLEDVPEHAATRELADRLGVLG